MKLTSQTPSVQESTRKIQGSVTPLKLPLIPSTRQISPDYSVTKQLTDNTNNINQIDKEFTQ